MMPRSLRVRSIVAAAVVVLLALVVVGVIVDVLVARQLQRSFDRTLRERAFEVAQLSAAAPALLKSPGALDAPLGGQQLEVEVLDRSGRPVARSSALGGRDLPVDGVVRRDVARGAPSYADIELGSDDLRAYVAPLAEARGPASGRAVAVAGTTHDVSSTLATVHLFVLIGALAAAVLAGSRPTRNVLPDSPTTC